MSRVDADSRLSPRAQPFLYATVALVAGILLDRFAEARFGFVGAGLLNGRLVEAAALVVVVCCATSATFFINRRGAAATLALLFGFLAGGGFLCHADRSRVAPSRLKRLYELGKITPNDPVELTGVLARPPEPAPGAFYLEVEAESIRTLDELLPVTGCARLRLGIAEEREFEALGLDYRSRIRVPVRLERAQTFKNPGSPDFNEFLELRGYDLKGSVKSPLLIENIGRASFNPVLGWLFRQRLRAMAVIDARFTPRVAGTLKAMLFGNRYSMDPRASQHLQQGSTFHVLSISGMHVGIIAWALLGSRSTLRKRRVARVAASLTVLWAYAVMVGLAPPVLRATLMITIGLIGPLLFRRAASINTVALAAFIMLAQNPAVVADPGFQLSFVAVVGIVALALPVQRRLQLIGEWRPTAQTPHPASCPRALLTVAECLFWDQRSFESEMDGASLRYRLDKSRLASALSQLRLQTLLRGLVFLVVTSVAVQLATLPLMVFYFNRVAPIGILLNIAAGLLTAFLMFAGIATILAGAVSSWLVSLLVWAVTSAHEILVNSVTPFTAIPGATFRVPHYVGWHSLLYGFYFVPLLLISNAIDRWRPVDLMLNVESVDEKTSRLAGSSKREAWRSLLAALSSFVFRPVIGVMLLGATLVAIVLPAPRLKTGRLSVYFLDVGQGDSALVVFPRGSTMLIDGGGEVRFMTGRVGEKSRGEPIRNDQAGADDNEDNLHDSAFSIGETVVSRFLWSRGLTHVDYVLATHSDQDHVGGLRDVIKNFSIGQMIIGAQPSERREFKRLVEMASRRGIPVGRVEIDQRFDIEGVSIEVLWPPGLARRGLSSGNDESIVMRLVYGSVSVLLTGDIEKGAEEELIRSGRTLSARILKIPHHGSKTSSTEPFLSAVQPALAVISVGERSRFGHPDPDVVKRYLAHNVRLLKTGDVGTVTVTTDGLITDVEAYQGGRFTF